MISNAVQEAVELLRTRREEAARELSALRKEVEDITAALRSLGVDEAPVSKPVRAPIPDVGRGRKGTIRSAVQALFEAHPGAFSLDAVVQRLREEHQGDRTDDQFRSTVRTSLWTLRNANLIVPTGSPGSHIGTRWLPRDAEAPVAAGASDSGGSSDESPLEEGGPDNGSEPPQDRDGDAYLAQLHHGHAGDRASIVEAAV